jgi:starch-binding outer membrane protein SusE/F
MDVSLTAGTKFKFVGDDSWTTQMGADAKGDLVHNGGDIIVPKTGTFTVTLDLSGGGGNYVYSIK